MNTENTLWHEVSILIIGAIFGALLVFVFNQLEKYIQQKKEKKKAMMFLKIELRAIKSPIDALINTQATLGPSVPTTDIKELDMTIQASQFMYYEEKLAEKIYELSGCIRSANKHRQISYLQDRTKTTGSAEIFFYELKNAQKLLNGINALFNFE